MNNTYSPRNFENGESNVILSYSEHQKIVDRIALETHVESCSKWIEQRRKTWFYISSSKDGVLHSRQRKIIAEAVEMSVYSASWDKVTSRVCR